MTQMLQNTLSHLRQGGIIARLPLDLPLAYSMSVADALLAAPVLGVEVDSAAPDAAALTADLCRRAGGHMLVGVTGVETGAQLQTAVSAGAQFLSSDRFELEMMIYCREQGVVYLPGVISIMAAQLAANAGADMIRLRTGGSDGPAYLRYLCQTFPELGVVVAVEDRAEPEQTSAYAAAGAVAMLVGSVLFPTAAPPMAEIIAGARRFRTAWEAGRHNRPASPRLNGRFR